MLELTTPSVPVINQDRPLAYLFICEEQLTLVYGTKVYRDNDALTTIASWWSYTPDQKSVPRILVGGERAGNLASHDKRLATMISILRALGASGMWVELDRALGRKFPHEAERDLNGWVHALSLTPSGESLVEKVCDLMDAMFDICCEGVFNDDQEDLVRRLEREEERLVTTSEHYRQFDAAVNLADSWQAIQVSDPVGRDAYRKDGTIVGGSVKKITNFGNAIVVTDKPMKIRTGGKVTALPSHSGLPYKGAQEYYLSSSTTHADGVYELTLRPVRGENRLRVDDTVDLMETPFLVPSFVNKSKWFNRTPLPPLQREVPQWLGKELEA